MHSLFILLAACNFGVALLMASCFEKSRKILEVFWYLFLTVINIYCGIINLSLNFTSP